MLGIIDWGIGGIGVYKLVRERRPDVSVVYFSDTGVTPYGKMSRAKLTNRLNSVIRFMKKKGVTHLVIGCNAASTAIPFLDPRGMKIEGVIDAAVEMTNRLKPSRLGLIGGRRTVVSGVYRKALATRGIEVEQRIAQPLSGLIESGDVSSNRLREECKRILSPLKNCSHILLACTHYPAIAGMMKDFVSPETVFIDPAAELVKRTERWKLASGGSNTFYTSGDAHQMKTTAWKAFSCKIGTATNIGRISSFSMNGSLNIFKILDELVDQWCERRALCPLRLILPSYPLSNGLTDDWHRLYESLREVRAFCRAELSDHEQRQIGDVIVAVQQMIEIR